MGEFEIEISELANSDFKYFKKHGQAQIIRKIDVIIKQLTTTPFSGIGRPEALKYNLSGLWSRRLSLKDRLVYKVDIENNVVYILSAKGHYPKQL